MVNRWTPVYQRLATGDRIRSEDIERRSSGLRYWLLLPSAPILIYAGAAWILALILSPIVKIGRVFRTRTKHA